MYFDPESDKNFSQRIFLSDSLSLSKVFLTRTGKSEHALSGILAGKRFGKRIVSVT